ncbi:MAG: cysteine hydrolase [Anaerolineae bacterium]|nr:cysteine hydrolase [Anaerolineae bacterium]
MQNVEELIERSKPFLNYLVRWRQNLQPLALNTLVRNGRSPDQTALMAVDVINGFCRTGPLASVRVAGIVAPIVLLFQNAYALGMRHFIFLHDAHDPEAVEFGSYPAHCVRDSEESAPVPELKALPFFDKLVTMMPKNSVNAAVGTALNTWLDAHPEVNTFIVVGDCTDICVYMLAMHLRTRANAANRLVRVIVPANAVDTYDLPVETAAQTGALPHDGELLHLIFLYHMRLNGIEVVAAIE